MSSLVPSERIEQKILVFRGEKVMLDRDLAELYGVTTKRLNEQVKRNRERFPADFIFRLTVKEKAEVVANCDHLQKLKFSPNKAGSGLAITHPPTRDKASLSFFSPKTNPISRPARGEPSLPGPQRVTDPLPARLVFIKSSY